MSAGPIIGGIILVSAIAVGAVVLTSKKAAAAIPVFAFGAVDWASNTLKIDGNAISKQTSLNSWDFSSGQSRQYVDGDGVATFTAPKIRPEILTGENSGVAIIANHGMVVGITTNQMICGYRDIDYGFMLKDDGKMDIVENGASIFDPAFSAGDKLNISVKSGIVSYYQNGVLRYVSKKPLNTRWGVAIAIRGRGDTLSDANIQAGLQTSK